MTNVKMWNPLKRSEGEKRLEGFLRLCDVVIWLGLGSTVTGGYAWPNATILGLGVSLVTVSATVKLAGVLVAFHVMSLRHTNDEIAPWIRRWTRIASVFIALIALYVIVALPAIIARIGAGMVILWSVRLFRRASPLSIADLGAGWTSPEAAGILARGTHVLGGIRGTWGPELDALLTGAWLVGAIVVRGVMPSAFEPRIADPNELKIRLFAVVQAERRYYVAHRSYASDIGELQRLGFTAIDSLVSITVEGLGYRAVARDPRGHVSCGVWDGATMELRIEGTRPAEPTCWEDKAQAQ